MNDESQRTQTVLERLKSAQHWLTQHAQYAAGPLAQALESAQREIETFAVNPGVLQELAVAIAHIEELEKRAADRADALLLACEETRDLRRQRDDRVQVEVKAIDIATFHLQKRVEELEQEIAAAREACPMVRMQDHFDDSLLKLVQGEVSLLFRRESEACRLSEKNAALKRKVEDLANDRAALLRVNKQLVTDLEVARRGLDIAESRQRDWESAHQAKAERVAYLEGETEQCVKDRAAADAEAAKLRHALDACNRQLIVFERARADAVREVNRLTAGGL